MLANPATLAKVATLTTVATVSTLGQTWLDFLYITGIENET